MAFRWKTRARQIAMSLTFVSGVMAAASLSAAERATAILQSATGTPAIFELSSGEMRHASAVGIGRRYALPVEIETGAADSATFVLTNSVIEVSPNSLMRIVAPEDNDAGVVQRVLQQTGSSLFHVHRGTIDRFQVETPFLVSVVKGTVFNVLVRDDGATVSLQEGRLLVNSLDARQSVELAPGDVAFAGRDGALRMLKLELTTAGVKARESVAANSDTKAGGTKAPVTEVKVADAGAGVAVAVRATDAVGSVVGSTTQTVVSTVTTDVVDPVKTDVAAPVVDTLVDNTVAPANERVVAPVIDDVVKPVIETVAAPVTPVIAPVIDNVTVPVIGNVVDPVVSSAGSAVSALLNRPLTD